MTGPRLRTDVIDVYVLSRRNGAIGLLQLRRTEPPLERTWQPIMGHAEPGESAVHTALRELGEETGLTPADPAFLGFWALEQVHPFFLPELDTIFLSPRFVVEAHADWEPTLCGEHDASRWVRTPEDFLWPGQQAAVRELLVHIADTEAPARERLRITPGSSPPPRAPRG